MRVMRPTLVALCAIGISFSAHASSGSRQSLSPSATGDDTAQLQAALSKCSNSKRPCDLRLARGVFHTDVLLVNGFHGSITGAGEGRTIVRPLANCALRSNPEPFLTEPTLENPYPALLHFNNGGKISISRLTMEFPSSMRVAPYYFYLVDAPGIDDSLVAAILVEGDREAELQISRVTVIANDTSADAPYGSNIFAAVRFEGQIRYQGDVDVTRKLKRGRFVAHDNTFMRTGNGISMEDTERTTGLIFDNEFDSRIYSTILTNLSASSLAVFGNVMRSELEGVFVAQTSERPPASRSNYLISHNTINVNEDDTSTDVDGVGYDGIGVFDFAAYEDPRRGETFLANVTIWENDITVRDGEVLAGITVSGDGPGTVRVFDNRVYGTPMDAGVFVDLSRGTNVTRNDYIDLNPVSEVPGVYLSPDTRDCRVIEPREGVLDDGTNNFVISAPATTSTAAAKSSALAASQSTRKAPRRIGF